MAKSKTAKPPPAPQPEPEPASPTLALDDLVMERVGVDEIHLDPANVRTHPEGNLDAIKASLARFGQQKPIVIDSDNIVRAGNGLLTAARALGWTHVKAIRTNLKGSEATAYAIADNRTAELAEWDEQALGDQLRALHAEGFDMPATGFTADDLSEMLGEAAPQVPEEKAAEDNPDLAAFIAARKRAKERGKDSNETNFWVCLVFQSTAQKQEFLSKIEGVDVLYGMYADGQKFADKVNLPVTPNRLPSTSSPMDKNLVARVMG